MLHDKQCRSRSVGLHCLQRQGISGFSRTRVKSNELIEGSATMVGGNDHLLNCFEYFDIFAHID